MKRVYVTRKLPEPVLEALRARFDLTVRDDTSPMNEAELREVLASYDAVLPTLRDRLNSDAFTGTIRATLLANFGAGYNHIDIGAAQAAGLAVSNTPGAVTDATADIAMTLILMTCRRAGEGERRVRAGEWEGWHPTQFLGQHVTGKTLGVIGMGRIGKAIAARCHHGFGMSVVFQNRSTVEDPGVPARQLPTIADVMAAADIVVIGVPGGPATNHLIDAAALAAMKPTGFLINTSRGDVIDERALAAALSAGHIAGAGLDVYEDEPEITPELLGMENVTLLPHLGTATLEVRTDMGMVAVDNLLAWDEGRALPNLVTE